MLPLPLVQPPTPITVNTTTANRPDVARMAETTF
jgi:hypothetical protein